MAYTVKEDEKQSGDRGSDFHHIEATGGARQHNGHNYINNNYYRSPRLDRTLPEAECNLAFWEAVKSGQIHRAKHLLAVGANLDARDTKGRNTIHLAADHGCTEMAHFLLQRGADVTSSVGHKGIMATALTAACAKGNEAMVQLLLEFKADPNGKKENAISPLHAACMSKSPGVVRMLLKEGASPLQSSIGPIYERDELFIFPWQPCKDDKDVLANGRGQVMRGLPLHAAILCGNLQCAKLLLESDKTCAQSQIDIWNAIDWGSDTDLIKTLELKPDVSSPSLHLALRACTSTDMLGLLLDHGLDINHQNSNGWTALHLAACDNNRSDHIGVLLTRGASLEVRTEDNKKALRLALERDRGECLSAFIDCGVGLEYRNDANDSLLHLAALWNSIECAKTLLKLGIDINILRNARGDRGATPLHVALREGHNDMTKYLLDNGAPTEILDGRGKSPLHIAAICGRVHAIPMLLDRGAPINGTDSSNYIPAHYAARRGQADSLRLLVDKTTDFNPQEKFDGMTLLTNAVYRGYAEVAEILLDAGADPQKADPSGWSAVQLAKRLDIPEINELMRKRGLLSKVDKTQPSKGRRTDSPKEKRSRSPTDRKDKPLEQSQFKFFSLTDLRASQARQAHRNRKK